MSGSSRSQRGMALLLLLFLVFGVAITVALTAWNSSRGRLEQERKTQLALQQAKEALIAYAVSVYPVNDDRPGDLPCPDQDNDGRKENSCGNGDGTTGQTNRLGRLPWKDLGLEDLRDANGERLWYAVSNNFKEKYQHLPLNSDANGTIQVIDAGGTVIQNVIAVVIAPGPSLQRLNDAALQDRSAGGENNPANYLDETATEDNAAFVDGTTNGFVAGPIRDAQGRILVNDTMLYITYNDLMPLLEKQVASTVMNCLTSYAAYNVGGYNNLGRYPWAADMVTSAATPNKSNYDDSPNTLFGRVPSVFGNTNASAPNMLPNWGNVPSCAISHAWFRNNWREQVFYAIADAYKPGVGAPSCGTCLTVGTTNNVQVAVFVGRQTLAGQNRANRAIIGNYLEGENSTPYDAVFERNAISQTFNDLLVFK